MLSRRSDSYRITQIKFTQMSADRLYSSAKIREFHLRRSAGNIFLIILLLYAFNVNSQKLIRGMVVDSLSLNNLPGVTVKIKGSQHSAVTDINGIFLISANSNDVLAFSFLGYHAKAMPAQQDNDVMFVRMQEESILLNEVEIQ